MKIAVIGAGRMGSWLIRNLAHKHHIAVYDSDGLKARRANPDVLLNALADLRTFQPEIMINAVTLPKTVDVFEASLPFLPPECLLVDIASVKGGISEFYRTCGFQFASIHPMFGPTFADVQNLKEESAIIIKESDQSGARFFKDLFGRLGVNIYEYSFIEHDQMIAYSLSIPFASTIVFAASMTELAVPGTTFKKHLDIARGLLSEDDYLLAEIIFNPHTLPQLELITSRLEFLKHVVKQKDFQEAVRFFNRLRKNVQSEGEVASRPVGSPSTEKS